MGRGRGEPTARSNEAQRNTTKKRRRGSAGNDDILQWRGETTRKKRRTTHDGEGNDIPMTQPRPKEWYDIDTDDSTVNPIEETTRKDDTARETRSVSPTQPYEGRPGESKSEETVEYSWTCPICEEIGISDTKMGISIKRGLHFKAHHKRHSLEKAKTNEIEVGKKDNRGQQGAEHLWI